MTNEEVLKSFWLPNDYYNTTSTGANADTIFKYGRNTPVSVDYEEFINQKISMIVSESKKRQKKKKYLSKNPNFPYGFVQIVNDALESIYSGEIGLVLNSEQAIEVCSFLENPQVKIKDIYIYIYENKNKTKRR